MAKIREKLRKPGIAAFYAAFILIMFVDYVSATSIHVIYSGRMFQLAIILLMCKAFVTEYTKKEYMMLIFSLIIGAVSFLHVHNYFACLIFLLIFAGKDIPFKKAIAAYLIFVGICIAVTVSAACLGIYGEMSMIQDFRDMGVVEARYCFGFKHPNACHIVLLQFALGLIWYFWEQIKWFHILTVILLNGILFIFTDSRTNMLLGAVLLAIMLLGKIWTKIQSLKLTYGLGIIALASSLLLSLATVMQHDPNNMSMLMRFIDKIWSGRIYWGSYWANFCTDYTDTNGAIIVPREKISLFSHINSQISIDMGFIKLYYNYGIIIFIMVIALILIKLYRNVRSKDFAELMIIVSGIVWMLGEAFSFGEFITRNILFVFMLDLLQRQETQRENVDGNISTQVVEGP